MTDDQLSLDEELDTWQEWFARMCDPDHNPQLRRPEEDDRPPGIPDYAEPFPGNMLRCPKCRQERFDYMAADYGACERRQCAYEWFGRQDRQVDQGDR